MQWLSALLAAGGAAVLAAVLGSRKAFAAEREQPRGGGGGPGRLLLRTTGYWPTSEEASEAERRMEGGSKGAASWRGRKVVDPATGRRVVLRTLEDALSGDAAYASLSGDPDVWPWGQRIEIDAWPGVVFRVVDTGDHFKGANKTYRLGNAEPVDVRVASKRTKVPEMSGGRIVSGDNWEGGTPVAVFNLRGQNVTVTGYHLLGSLVSPIVSCVERGEAFVRSGLPYTEEDCAVLARAIQSSCPNGTIEERQAVGWVCRNRAVRLGVSLPEIVAPEGYGPRREAGCDFVSTAIPPDDVSLQVAKAVLLLRDEEDPTGGATDFWNPGQQDEAKLLADVQALLGEEAIEVFGSSEARQALVACGLQVVGRVGGLELLRA